MGRTIPMLQAINEALRIAMASDPDVILLGEDVAGGGGRADQGIEEAWGGIMGATRGLVKRFGPERVLDTPISEMGFVAPRSARPSPGCARRRADVHRLPRRLPRPDAEPGREAPLHVRRQGPRAADRAHARRRGPARGGPALADALLDHDRASRA